MLRSALYLLLFSLPLAQIPAQDEDKLRITRGPYLQRVLSTTAAVIWRTSAASESAIRLTNSDGITRTIEADRRLDSIEHHASLENLDPGTEYRYEILDAGNVLADHEGFKIRTAPLPDDSSFRVAVIGDSGSGRDDQYLLAKYINSMDVELFLHTGDVFYTSDVDEVLFDPYRPIFSRACFVPSRGNHDLGLWDELGWIEIFDPPQSRSAAPGIPGDAGAPDNPSNSELFFSFDWGNAHFAALDVHSETQDFSEQLDWLDADLSRAREAGQIWLVLYFHFPVYSIGPDLASNPDQLTRSLITPIADRHEVDLVLSGHDHIYHRTHPIRAGVTRDAWQSPDLISPRGTTYIITGGGGQWLYGALPSASRNQTAAFRAAYHVLELDFRGEELRGRAIDSLGQEFDAFSIRKDSAPPEFRMIRGDIGGDGDINISDAISILAFLFQSDPLQPLACIPAADANDSRAIDLADAVYLLSHLFLGGPAPPAPFPDCGPADDADCTRTSC